jgi:uncharacterized protein (TIRG00374 family)
MLVRLAFLTRQGVSAGSVAVIYVIEDIAGLVIGSFVFAIGVVALINTQPSTLVRNITLTTALGSAALIAGCVYLMKSRRPVERGTHWLAARANRLGEKIFHRALATPTQVQRTLDDFYAGLTLARRAPLAVAAAFGLNVVRHAAGIAALYFTFAALDHAIAPGVLILIYTSANILSTTSAVPGEVAMLGGGFALLFLSFGVAPDVALLALLLSRAIAFWLPLPVGYLAFWNLRRRAYL